MIKFIGPNRSSLKLSCKNTGRSPSPNRRASLLIALCILGRPALCLAQNGNLVVAAGTINQGAYTYSAANNISNSSNTVTINGSAAVLFTAGSSITLMPGFRATAGAASITFHATVNSSNQTTGISQGLSPAYAPTKEYIYLGSRPIAIENH